MKDNFKGKYKVFLELGNGIQIRTDALNWILFIPTRTYLYFPTIVDLLNVLIDYRLKQTVIKNPESLQIELVKTINSTIHEIKDLINSKLYKTNSFKGFRRSRKDIGDENDS